MIEYTITNYEALFIIYAVLYVICNVFIAGYTWEEYEKAETRKDKVITIMVIVFLFIFGMLLYTILNMLKAFRLLFFFQNKYTQVTFWWYWYTGYYERVPLHDIRSMNNTARDVFTKDIFTHRKYRRLVAKVNTIRPDYIPTETRESNEHQPN